MSLIARWDIISYCNLKCIHCRSEEFYSLERQISPTLEEAYHIVDTLATKGVTALNILGGEPFAYRHILEVLQYSVNRGLDVFVTTNGVLLTEACISRLLDIGLKQVTISLDGSCPEINDRIRGAGVFAKASKALHQLIDAKARCGSPNPKMRVPTIAVNCVLTKINREDVATLAEFAIDLGVDSFRLSPLDEIGNARDHLQDLRVSPAEQLEVAEQMMDVVARHPQIKFSILDLKPLVLEYLYEKTGVPVPLNVAGCKACTHEIYIQPEGLASPCLATAKQAELVRANTLRDYSQPITELPVLNKGVGFSDFQSSFVRSRTTYEHYVPCNRCSYAGNLCRPCPLGGARSQTVTYEMCQLAEAKLIDISSVPTTREVVR